MFRSSRTTPETAVGTAAKLLFGDYRVAGLADHFKTSKGTARSWINGSREPPIEVLEELSELLVARDVALGEVVLDLKTEVAEGGAEDEARLN